ncbi:helix-turn-helix domain-containing protein [Chloroflexota bacterium]
MNPKRNEKSKRPISKMLTTAEVGCIFNVHAGTIRRWGERGIIKSYRVGLRADLRFRREDVAIAYLDRAIQTYLKC